MKHNVAIFVTTLAVGAALGAIGSRIVAAQQGSESRTVLLTKDLVGIEGHEVRMWQELTSDRVSPEQSTTTPGRNAFTSLRAP